MSGQQALINELQTAIESVPKERRAKTLRALTEVFVDVADRLPEELVEVFGGIIGHLIETIEPDALVALAEKLAPLPKAPSEVVQRLAGDPNIAVAGVVLAHSEVLTTSELAELAASTDEKHLLAIARRKHLETPVTDAALKHRFAEVARVLAGNAGAEFSETGLRLLLEIGANDAPTAEKLVQRAEITPAYVNALVARADEAVRKMLVATAPAQRRAAVQAAVEKNSKAAVRNESAAQAYAHMIKVLAERHANRLTEADVLGYATARKPVEVICALAMICKVPPEVIESLLDERRREPLLMVCKAGNFKWQTVRALLEMREPPGAALQNALTQACEEFNRIAPAVAQQAVMLWKRKAS
ncbi:MAG: DUF2336 domain-containing protein [Xanthobacteraceae bacterium]